MKKVFLYLMFVAVVFAFSFDSAKSVIDWTGKVPPPCTTIGFPENSQFHEYGNWQGPFEYFFQSDICPGCRMHAVYYQRIDKQTMNGNCVFYNLQISLGGIFYESIVPGQTDCSTCPKPLIITESISQIYKMNSQRQSFRDSSTNLSCVESEKFFFTSTMCKGINYPSLSCNQRVCCRRGFQYIYEGNTKIIIGITPIPSEIQPFPFNPTCPPGCTYDCDDIIYNNYAAVTNQCPIPCDWGEWLPDETVNFPFATVRSACAGCMIKTTYQKRQCDQYIDYKIKSFTLSDSCNKIVSENGITKPCIEMYSPDYEMQLKQASMEAILAKYYIQHPLAEGKCEDFNREISTSCWKRINYIDSTIHPIPPPRVKWVMCDSIGKCCYSSYKACKNNGVYTFEKLFTTSYISICDSQDSSCVLICGDYPRIINHDNKDKGMINPIDKDKTILYFNNVLNKNENYQLQILSMNGNEVLNEIYTSSEEMKYFAFENKKINTGNYYFIVTHNNIILSKGMLNVQK